MKLAKILATLTTEPLLCTNEYRAVLLELFQQHAEMERAEFKYKRTGKARSGSDLDVEQTEVRDGIAFIPVGGPMAIELGEFEKGAGAVDMDDIRMELQEAEDSDEVKASILAFDSPGGTFNGTFELCEFIESLNKRVYSFTRGMMASGAYALACSTDGIFATSSATIGSIGVYTVHHDLSRMAAEAGIAVKVFSSGPIKGAGVPGTSLTLEQQVFMQQRVMGMAKVFYDHVRANRGGVSDADMGGQFYTAEEAGERGFIDGLVRDIEELADHLRVD